MSRFNFNKRRDTFGERYRILITVIIILMAALVLRLFLLTVIQHNTWASRAEDQSTKTIYTAAPRGDIYDRNGKIIATSKQIFSVTFNSTGLETEEINSSCLILAQMLEKNGDTIIDKFPVKISSSGNLYYTYDEEIDKWLKSMNLPSGITAKQALDYLEKRYDISTETDRYEAYDLLTGTYNLSIPIDVKTMRYTYTNEKRSFLEKWGFWKTDEIKEGISAKDCFNKLREKYKINKDYSDATARKIFIIRNLIADNGYAKYNDIVIAKEVSDETIAYIEEDGIKGASIATDYKRYYPNKELACHIIGYLGSISEDQLDYYVKELGYSSTDLVGKDGIEAAYETKLHGKAGVKVIQVNSSGAYVSTISESEPVKGKDIYLTIDIDLQKAAEEALASQIQSVGGACQSGAVVAMDTETSEVLAMASNPSYDPNIFASGISNKAWASVQAENPRDSMSPAPLYNNATMASVAPGSTFKPITAITALELGLDPNMYIHDNQYIEMGGHRWATDAYNNGLGSYGNENLTLGIGHSSNYYFYCIGTGKNWGTGSSLGYNITIDDIMNTAEKFGLGQKTGIELNETVTPIASAKRKLAGFKTSVWNYCYNNAHKFFTSDIAEDYDKLKKNLDEISSWVEDNPSYSETVELLKSKTDVRDNMVETLAERLKYDYFNQAEWTVGDQFNISIGQGDNAYTPLQICTYISTLGNNGTYNRASVVKGVEGEGSVDKSSDSRKIELKDETISSVLKGMRYVCTNGTLAKFFANYDIPVAGKTGTAENQGIKQPASEVDYVKQHLSSFNSRAGTSVTWAQVQKEMYALMKDYPDRYGTEDDTVDAALIAASGYKINTSMINAYKGSYDFYSWTVTLAPSDAPKLSVVSLFIQGGYSSNAAPVNKSVIDEYFKLYGSGKYNSSSSKSYVKTDQNGNNRAQ